MIDPADAYTGSNGVKQPPTRNVLTLAWIKYADTWLIAQAQNTIEASAAPPKQTSDTGGKREVLLNELVAADSLMFELP